MVLLLHRIEHDLQGASHAFVVDHAFRIHQRYGSHLLPCREAVRLDALLSASTGEGLHVHVDGTAESCPELLLLCCIVAAEADILGQKDAAGLEYPRILGKSPVLAVTCEHREHGLIDNNVEEGILEGELEGAGLNDLKPVCKAILLDILPGLAGCMR